jgi:putative endopeptidase
MKKISSNLVLIVMLGSLFLACNRDNNKVKLIDPLSFDTAYRPQDNFFMYVNGTWLKNTNIPPSEASWGSFNILNEKSQKDLFSILDTLSKQNQAFSKGSSEQIVSDLYSASMDSTLIEKNGIASIQDDLNKIKSINKPDEILIEVARENKVGAVSMDYDLFPSNIISFYVYQDDKNSEKVVVHFDQGTLGLPTKDYYFPQDSDMIKIKQEYIKYVGKMFSALGEDQKTAEKKAKQVVELETKLADASKAPVELRDPIANYNKFYVGTLDKDMTGIHWNVLLNNLEVKVDTVLMGQPKYYEALNKLLYNVPVEIWKDYLQYRLVSNFAGVLSSNFSDPTFNFYGKTLQGMKERRPRWKRMTDMVNSEVGDALGQLYVKKFFPPEAKEKMLNLVNNLQESYKNRILAAEWMNDSTKQKAIEKLSAIIKKIAYPDSWKEYKDVEIDRNNIIASLKSTRSHKYKVMINKIGKPVDKTEWFMTPSTVNAYYNSNMNEIVFPAAILQPPFFNMEADDAINYGAIGTVIAHEITHGFDDQGRKFDSKGNLTDWWTADDASKYNVQAKRIIEQFGNYTILDSMHLNGELTQGENIADLGGLIISYNAFKMTEQGQSNTKIDGFTPDQRFFLSYATVWQSKMTDEITRVLVTTDPHSPPVFRVNGALSNIPEFYQAFGVMEGDKLFCPDSLRVRVW